MSTSNRMPLPRIATPCLSQRERVDRFGSSTLTVEVVDHAIHGVRRGGETPYDFGGALFLRRQDYTHERVSGMLRQRHVHVGMMILTTTTNINV